jgi:hypothetical protein
MYSLPIKPHPLLTPTRRAPVVPALTAVESSLDPAAAVAAIIETQRHLARVLHEHAGTAYGRDPSIRAIRDALARATAILEAASAPAAAVEETICWQCSKPIVAGRVATPRDVRRHIPDCGT